MGRLSRENDILELFFNYPTKHWQFIEIKKMVNISESKISKWLHKFEKEKLILKVKIIGKMPYYVSNDGSSEYYNAKKLFGINMIHNSGLLNKLCTIGAKSVILFGSFSRGDWHKDSDIDIFIYGNIDNLNLVEYRLKLDRDLHIFSVKVRKDFEKFGEGLIKNIVSGDIITGTIDFVEVKIQCPIIKNH
jgi:predicted nucleotidyltransferase